MTERITRQNGVSMDALLIDRHFRLARVWSNDVLRDIGPLVEGDVVNVSAWMDDDKEGGKYKSYFPKATSYCTTNYGGYRGEGDGDNILLDLEDKLPEQLEQRFDLVFNHSTLNHVFDIFTAVSNLCRMSRDLVIVVVPHLMDDCSTDSFEDYWRFMPSGISGLFRRNGFEVVMITTSPFAYAGVYHFLVASRHPERWRDRLTPPHPVNANPKFVRESWVLHLLRRARRAFRR